jgi:hypothetical protein
VANFSSARRANRTRRARSIVWTVVAAFVVGTVALAVLSVTSPRWFCARGCHVVQDESAPSYQHSTHARIGCIECHMPADGNAFVFMMPKMEQLAQLAITVSHNYDLALNSRDEVSLTMSSAQCVRCHKLAPVYVTAWGLRIDHKVHAEKGISCTICHNRMDALAPSVIDAKNGARKAKRPNFIAMTACYRCHGLEPGAPASGICSVCHTPGFDLQPPGHRDADFLTKKHAVLEAQAKADVARAIAKTGEPPATVERKSEWMRPSTKAHSAPLGTRLVSVGAVFYCATCHVAKFCTDCHGVEMPHSAEFMKPAQRGDPLGHPAIAKHSPSKCVVCHTKNDPNFCVNCHHGKLVNYVFDPRQQWRKVHPRVAQPGTLGNCYAPPLGVGCHARTYCTDCHYATLKRAGV